MFDVDLLKKSKEERVKFFKEYTIQHPKFTKVKDEVIKEINSSDYNIIMVIGPSRIGKSRLVGELIFEYLKNMEEEIRLNPGIIPISGMELPNPDLSRFNWKDFYFRVLTALKDPLIDEKIDIENEIIRKEPKKYLKPFRKDTAPELRISIESAFRNRKTRAFLIDEAQHFFKVGGGSEALNVQFNSIKSLSNMTSSKFVMFGTYDLNQVINLDGQLTSRVKEVHFPRYDVRNREDAKFFKSVVYTLQKVIPVEEEPNFLDHTQYLYNFSIGCIGLLKQWLERALSDALSSSDKTITIEHLERNSLNQKKILTLAREAIKGESDFIEKEEDRIELQEILYGSVKKSGSQKKEDDKSTDKGKHKRSKPGQRNPHRDQVGTVREDESDFSEIAKENSIGEK
ncbi:TniB family NTP-binding protein [Niallia sp. Sow4_A1]|nr:MULTISPECIES: TniB family NTP-binding protein [Bacillaceae]MCF2647096.1 AAA family ATPase [Niallia circulans]MCM3364007.1 TniB family NTP-binding protein [Niallia sp. MER TA 168]